MKKSPFDLIFLIQNMCKERLTDKEFFRDMVQKANTEYDIPVDIMSDILSLRKTPDENNTFLLFLILKTLNENSIPAYFTKAEIKAWENEKYHKEEFSLPIKFDVVQISGDQWVGKTSVKQLMELRDAHFIRYNEKTQRTLRRITRNGEESFEIAINKKAVKEIADSLKNGTYIPNIITLNIPEDAAFKYSEKKNELKIEKASYIDILDGYHRYLAMSSLFIADPSFDYPMEIRLVSYPEEKAKQFIWQEDQKTKMRKVDSDFLNQESSANIFVDLLGDVNPFKKNIGRNNEIINGAYLAKVVSYFIKNKEERGALVSKRNDFVECAKELEGRDNNLFSDRWTNQKIVAFVVGCEKWRQNHDDFVEDYDEALRYINGANLFNKSQVRSVDIKRLTKAVRLDV